MSTKDDSNVQVQSQFILDPLIFVFLELLYRSSQIPKSCEVCEPSWAIYGFDGVVNGWPDCDDLDIYLDSDRYVDLVCLNIIIH
jgi:hypothetical protein